MGIYLMLTFLLVEETTFIRSKSLDNDIHEHLAGETDSTVTTSEFVVENKGDSIAVREADSGLVSEKRFTYWQKLKIYNGRFSRESYLEALTAPFRTFLLPAVAWAAYAYACGVAFASAFSVSLAQIFSKPPYNFQPGSIGLMVLSAFVGAVLGNAVSGGMADWLVKALSRRNNGVYEPEFRLLLGFPSLLLGIAGFWGFGLSIDAQNHWMVPVFFFGLATFAGAMLSLISNTYLLDCHRKYAQDSYAAVTLIKGLMAFALTFAINPWVAKNGVKQVFFIIGLIHASAAVWGLVLYVYGKRVSLFPPLFGGENPRIHTDSQSLDPPVRTQQCLLATKLEGNSLTLGP